MKLNLSRNFNGMTKATWINGKKKITGKWEYRWSSDSFIIILDNKDRITGQQRRLISYNDTPEWGNWKLQR